jgi:hypothetical protein
MSDAERMTRDELAAELRARKSRFHEAVAAEVACARAKFPGNRHQYVALAEEVGEVAKALIEGESPEAIYAECVQVAAMAQRVAEDGDDDFRYDASGPDGLTDAETPEADTHASQGERATDAGRGPDRPASTRVREEGGLDPNAPTPADEWDDYNEWNEGVREDDEARVEWEPLSIREARRRIAAWESGSYTTTGDLIDKADVVTIRHSSERNVKVEVPA